jgi:hypothetical protein
MDRLKCLLLAGAWVLVIAAITAGPAVAAKGGNNENAHACQQGGHETLVAAEDPTISFKNAGDCASHGAKGADASSLTIDTTHTYPCPLPPGAEPPGPTCWGFLSGSGLLLPATGWTVQLSTGDFFSDVAAGGSIDSLALNLLCERGLTAFAIARTSADMPIRSATVTSPCG